MGSVIAVLSWNESAMPGSRVTLPKPVSRPISTQPPQIATNAGRHRMRTGQVIGRRSGSAIGAVSVTGPSGCRLGKSAFATSAGTTAGAAGGSAVVVGASGSVGSSPTSVTGSDGCAGGAEIV